MLADLTDLDWRLAGLADALWAGETLSEHPRRLCAWVEETARRIRLFPNASRLAKEWEDRHPACPRHQLVAELRRLWPALRARVSAQIPAELGRSYRWDVFVAHAAQDIQFVWTLCRAMRAYHLRVWIDRDELTIGDSIRRTIDTALPQCRYGVVVFSPNSIGRTWLHRELDALTQLETNDRKVILPVLHDITPAELDAVTPLLSGRLGLTTSDHTVEHLAYEIARAIATGR
jgi:hypothetical protein